MDVERVEIRDRRTLRWSHVGVEQVVSTTRILHPLHAGLLLSLCQRIPFGGHHRSRRLFLATKDVPIGSGVATTPRPKPRLLHATALAEFQAICRYGHRRTVGRHRVAVASTVVLNGLDKHSRLSIYRRGPDHLPVRPITDNSLLGDGVVRHDDALVERSSFTNGARVAERYKVVVANDLGSHTIRHTSSSSPSHVGVFATGTRKAGVLCSLCF